MKKKVHSLSCTNLVAVIFMFLSMSANAMSGTLPPDQDHYWIESLEIIPSEASTGDVISVVASTAHPSGGCDLTAFNVSRNNKFVFVDATYEQGMLTYICHSVDTIPLGTFLPGNYLLIYDWLDTISFTVYQQPEDCQAFFTYIYAKCQFEKCINTVSFLDSSKGDVVSWLWEFGDGESSEEQNPVHTYDNAGVYEVCLTINTSGGCISTYCEKVPVGITEKCKADFRWEPLRCTDNVSRCYGFYQFIDMSYGDVIRWYWNFGDGQTSAEQNPVHAYKNDGIYQVSLTILTAYGCMDTKTDTLVMGDTLYPGCRADFRWEPLHCWSSILPCPRSFSFTDMSRGDPVKWYWHFGDGDTSTYQNPVHTYPCDGEYVVSLVIVTSSGCSDIRLYTITVGDSLVPCCEADFEWEELYPNWDCQKKSTDCITPNYYVQFTDRSIGPPLSWKWDFGDGTMSSEQNPMHEYKFSGTYNVCLNITCPGWCFDVICRTITIGDTIPGPCEADFTVTQKDLICPVACFGCWCVQFADLSSLNTVEWAWSFGDGDTSSLRNPFHIYFWQQGDQLFRVCLKIKTSDHCVDSICKLYDPQSGSLLSGLEDIPQTTEDLTLFPNPASGEIYVRLPQEILDKKCLLNILDMYGRQLFTYSYAIGETGDGIIGLNIANLINGQYICSIVADNKLYKSRFSVTK